MPDVLLYGNGPDVRQADALTDYSASPESASVDVISKPVLPAGLDGEVVFRVLYINVRHKAGVAFTVTPMVDSKLLQQYKTGFTRPAPANGLEERHQFRLPMSKRGKIFQIRIQATDPVAAWNIENAAIAFSPLNIGFGGAPS